MMLLHLTSAGNLFPRLLLKKSKSKENVNIEYHCTSIETCCLHGSVKLERQKELSEDSMTSRQI